ncbi:DUF1977 domain-containing protein [Lysobacter aestuarii]|uniref:DUF1977 domain-containing protein n=1 Tax=Marilutibacter aestuarii TaxID=1706195 RepID=A0A508ANV3_9GAMM|nr:DUF1977 domain-containing protein [Lysobacter aestuarii]
MPARSDQGQEAQLAQVALDHHVDARRPQHQQRQCQQEPRHHRRVMKKRHRHAIPGQGALERAQEHERPHCDQQAGQGHPWREQAPPTQQAQRMEQAEHRSAPHQGIAIALH